jgi:hypothetical protein
MNFSPTPAATVGPGGQAVSNDQPSDDRLGDRALIDQVCNR